jgi:hypothetical protein
MQQQREQHPNSTTAMPSAPLQPRHQWDQVRGFGTPSRSSRFLGVVPQRRVQEQYGLATPLRQRQSGQQHFQREWTPRSSTPISSSTRQKRTTAKQRVELAEMSSKRFASTLQAMQNNWMAKFCENEMQLRNLSCK